jgi:hypothetical protein
MNKKVNKITNIFTGSMILASFAIYYYSKNVAALASAGIIITTWVVVVYQRTQKK